MLVVEARWNDPLLLGVVRRGVNKHLQDAGALCGCPESLNSLISLTTELDNYFRDEDVWSDRPQ